MRIVPQSGPVQKPQKAKGDPAYMAKVAQLPCVICEEFGMSQQSPTQVHHCIHGRHGTKKRPDTETIPLCEGHHQGLRDTSKVALHREPKEWKARYGLDTDYIEKTKSRVGAPKGEDQ